MRYQPTRVKNYILWMLSDKNRTGVEMYQLLERVRPMPHYAMFWTSLLLMKRDYFIAPADRTAWQKWIDIGQIRYFEGPFTLTDDGREALIKHPCKKWW